MIPRTLLIAASAFEKLSAEGVASAIAGGLAGSGFSTEDCPLKDVGDAPSELRALLDAVGFEARMRRARAVILAEWRLAERTLAGSPVFEIATRARQAGVPAYAVTADNTLSAFDARILDLQVILEASTPRGLQSAGRRLGKLV